MELTLKELDNRRVNFIRAMEEKYPNWDTALIIGKVNQYYFTGSIQDAVLIIRKDGRYSYNVRRSFERALDESPLPETYPMKSYREAAQREGRELGNTYIEADILPYSMVERLKGYFHMTELGALDQVVKTVRSVKSPYELYWTEASGKQHDKLLIQAVPGLLKEGMSEAEFLGALTNEMYRHDYHGLARFDRFQTEMMIGQIGFGTNSLYPTNFDGPGGSRGNSAAVPAAADPKRILQKGDLVFVDIAFGINGYHSDKTQVYMFGAQPSSEVLEAHRFCMDIQRRLALRLRPGEIPSHIYGEIMATLIDQMKKNFMGFGERSVKFFGHGVGLHVDELPVIAKGFDKPLLENMVIALEPKKGVAKVGTVGVEDTYIVTPSGGKCITGGGRDIIVV